MRDWSLFQTQSTCQSSNIKRNVSWALCNICALKPLWNTNPAAHYTSVNSAVWMLSLMWFHSASRNLYSLNGICCVITLQYFGPGGVPSCELKRWILENGLIVAHILWAKHFLTSQSAGTLTIPWGLWSWKSFVHYLLQWMNTACVDSFFDTFFDKFLLLNKTKLVNSESAT